MSISDPRDPGEPSLPGEPPVPQRRHTRHSFFVSQLQSIKRRCRERPELCTCAVPPQASLLLAGRYSSHVLEGSPGFTTTLVGGRAQKRTCSRTVLTPNTQGPAKGPCRFCILEPEHRFHMQITDITHTTKPFLPHQIPHSKKMNGLTYFSLSSLTAMEESCGWQNDKQKQVLGYCLKL